MRKNVTTPCLGCEDRWVTDNDRCHAHCEKYLSFKGMTDAENDKVYSERNKLGNIERYEKARAMRVRQGRFR